MDAKPEARLTIVVGLTGAGKTTLARSLEAIGPAVRLNPDEWMTDLGITRWDEPFRDRQEQRLIGLTGQLLRSGTDVIVEYGSWARSERDQLLGLGRRLHRLPPAVAAADRG